METTWMPKAVVEEQQHIDGVSGTAPVFRDERRAPAYGALFHSAEFSAEAIEKLPALAPYANQRVAVAAIGMQINPLYGARAELQFQVTTGDMDGAGSGYFFARALKGLSTRRLTFGDPAKTELGNVYAFSDTTSKAGTDGMMLGSAFGTLLLASAQVTTLNCWKTGLTQSIFDAIARHDAERIGFDARLSTDDEVVLAAGLKDILNAADNGEPYSTSELLGDSFKAARDAAWRSIVGAKASELQAPIVSN
ncbi:hypothetical protein LA345_40995 (plasmid) [Burkholderia vietnamiensis]|uniref:Uncharacterized protein n=1 Tax=Burkholderia vietnamiensis (strain G4 / LMG 22486) TaxID=269482 RepID=A4JTR4_BURVG|nr:hypothetical protein Bcep1808_6779 [Burkholderia vietnamiensis G4]MCB4350175.1 hypothetical protein [Burkholderia vietnamiensis]